MNTVHFAGGSSKIRELPCGRSILLVDEDDYEWASQYIWSEKPNGNTVYARRIVGKNQILIHREICGLNLGEKLKVDHRDGNGLNNCRLNLRVCTNKQNLWNMVHRKPSVAIGVRWEQTQRGGFWTASICIDDTLMRLGKFATAVEAAEAYNEMALKHRGEFAWLNDIDELKRRNIQPSDRVNLHTRPGRHRKFCDDEIAKMQAMYDSGMTQYEIASAIGAAQSTVCVALNGTYTYSNKESGMTTERMWEVTLPLGQTA